MPRNNAVTINYMYLLLEFCMMENFWVADDNGSHLGPDCLTFPSKSNTERQEEKNKMTQNHALP